MAKAEENKKYKDIIEKAKELFWKHGFKKVSIEEICKKAHVSKMTFYKYFESKIELAKYILDREIEKSINDFRTLMRANITAEEKIRSMVQMKIEGTKEISKELLEDLYFDKSSELAIYFFNKSQETWRILIEEFRLAQANGSFRHDFNPEFLVALMYKMAELINDKELQSYFSSPQQFILELTNLFAYGISPHK